MLLEPESLGGVGNYLAPEITAPLRMSVCVCGGGGLVQISLIFQHFTNENEVFFASELP